jgi:hypothetical protein
MKRASKLLLIMLALYVLLVVLFESLLGFYQPQQSNTMVITTFEDDLQANDRVVERLEIEGEIFVAVNHWPRAWARRLRNNPDIQMSHKGVTGNFSAVVLSGTEHEQGKVDFSVPFLFKFITGFPPRFFVRLDPSP